MPNIDDLGSLLLPDSPLLLLPSSSLPPDTARSPASRLLGLSGDGHRWPNPTYATFRGSEREKCGVRSEESSIHRWQNLFLLLTSPFPLLTPSDGSPLTTGGDDRKRWPQLPTPGFQLIPPLSCPTCVIGHPSFFFGGIPADDRRG